MPELSFFDRLLRKIPLIGGQLQKQDELLKQQERAKAHNKLKHEQLKKTQHALQRKLERGSLRLRVSVLYEQFKGNQKRLHKMQRVLREHPDFAERYSQRIDTYFGAAYRDRKRINRELLRLIDYPIAARRKGEWVTHVETRKKGWMTCYRFITSVEKGEFPIFTIRENRNGDQFPVRVPWIRMVEEMLNLTRDEEFGVVYNRHASSR
jgi:hypothetical protein